MKMRTLLVLLIAIGLLAGQTVTAQDKSTITLATWGVPSEIEGFQRIAERYEADHPDVDIVIEERPAQGYQDQAMVELAAGEAPDILRAGFRGQFAFYAQAGGTIDFSPYLEEGFADDFLPGAWRIAQYDGKPYGIPRHTDTFGVFVNTDYFEQIGVEIPQSMDECWSWEEFTDISRRLIEETDAEYGHAANWGVGKRFMMILYENGGQVLNDDLTAPTMTEPEVVEAIAWVQSWYEDGLTPLSTSIKGQEQAQNLFINGTIGMLIHGSFLMPWLEENMTDYGWAATYMPCKNLAGADFGGTGLIVTKDSDYPDIAVDFVKFATNTENMIDFSLNALFIPVRKSALAEPLAYPQFADEMNIFAEIASLVGENEAGVQGHPKFGQIDLILADELDLAFATGQSAEQTAENIQQKIEDALSE
jgi:ABC-type glycerol-3-phosphate transport system substrate-binding protein